jgi:hypothetical protein
MPNLGLARDEVADILAHIETKTDEVRTRQASLGPPAAAPR